MGLLSEKINGHEITVTIKSSNLKEATYNTETKTLVITFNSGSIYEYYDVSWEVFTKFRMTPSQGKFFSSNINGKYKYKKVSR